LVAVSQEHIAIVDGASGPQPRIVGSRIRVSDVAIWHERMGMSAEEIVRQHPTITKADVFAALAYYWDHRDEIDHLIDDEHAEVEMRRSASPSRLAGKRERPSVG
jgi:uncharacterized protein (DUF433 family)